ncbi:hypothetical protein PVAP13_4NG315100 [Panicum virgatum]|uniref:rRNA N-glycosylase n=1 Tax=Panicum virgatum TaxID=38727 RepID=A0A8T0TFE5_PANVG|nr:hypothetical protein PVAP13_4NG315100 [Panicum virgatum]
MAGVDEYLVGLKELFAEDPYDTLLRNLYQPRQLGLSEVPVYLYDLAKCPEIEFPAMTKARLGRFRCLALLLLGDHLVPVLPLRNPDTGISHHILRLIDSSNPSFKVDLLFRDSDLYFAGFRRAIVSPEGEEQWGEWFIYGDLIADGSAPEFLNAVNMGLGSAHRSRDVTRAGGENAMQDMFFTLARFEDRVRIIKNGEHPAEPQADEAENEPTGENKDAKNYREARMTTKLKSDLERAVARVIVVFSEALRFRSLYNEILKRLTELRWDDAQTLHPRLWKLINGWGTLSNFMQKMLHDEGTLDLATVLPSKLSMPFGFATMTIGDLIGPQGELMVAKRDLDHISQEALQRRSEVDGAANVQDPGFPSPTATEEEHEF